MGDDFEFALKSAQAVNDRRWVEWGLCDEFSIEHAALLSSGYLPDNYPWDFTEWEVQNWPEGLYPIFTAIRNAVTGHHLHANRVYRKEFLYGVERSVIDTASTTIYVDDLYSWFKGKNKTPFTFGLLRTRLKQTIDESDLPGYLNENHEHFSWKLKAAIDSWEAVNNVPKLKITPKQAITKWLRENAANYDLIKGDGSPNESGIAEIAKIAHWRTKGGALKTPESEEKILNTEPEDSLPF